MSFYPLTKLQALSSTLELFDTNDLDQNEFNLTKWNLLNQVFMVQI